MDLSLSNPWVFVSVNVIMWVVVGLFLQMAFFGGEWISAIIQGVFGGVACGLVLFKMRQY
jgi:hypothetical protein